MSNETIHLGFEVGTGKPVRIPCRNMVVTGQTQEAGKTTTLEALISRSGLPAIAFITKRGEGAFADATDQPPYFRERADWQFVSSILEATMREKLKFERNWIIKASAGARTLSEVHANVKRLLPNARGINEGVYTTLDAYLEIVVPRVRRVMWANDVSLASGVNVMNLGDRNMFPPELQALVMSSVLEWIYENAQNTIALIPEAWEFIPQGRNSPVKLAATQLVRKGSGLGNYTWLDSQDIGGVEKEILRSCPVWLLGVQREANEIARTLSNIPSGIAKPKASDLAILERGQFYACWGKFVYKVYVQPKWMDGVEAVAIATGEQEVRSKPKSNKPKESTVNEQEAAELRKRNADLQAQNHSLTIANERLTDRVTVLESRQRVGSAEPKEVTRIGVPQQCDTEALYQSILNRITKEPAIIALKLRKPEIRVSDTKEVIELDGKTLKGRIAKLIISGHFNEPRNGQSIFNELGRLGFETAKPNVYRDLKWFAEEGFLTSEVDGYKVVAGMKGNLKFA